MSFSSFNFLVDRTIIYTAIPNTARQTKPPVADVMARRNRGESSPPNWDSMAVSRASMETRAEARLMALAAERAGLLCLRNLTTLTTAVIML